MRKILQWLPVAVVLLASNAFAQIGDPLGLSPFWHWKTIETEHFRLSFPAELEVTAQKAGNYLEEAHSVLSPKLYWEPHTKTQILVVDNADAANGLTSPVGRFGILLIVTPPDQTFSTQYYDEWLRLLTFHEYTHLLNMDTTRGIWAGLRYVFGDILLPNAAWPSWMLEGLAVYMETRYTHAGRGRSPYYDMLLRSAVEAGVLDSSKFITLDKVNGPNPYFPFGETAYAFGYQLMNQVAETDVGPRTADQLTPVSLTGAGHPGEDLLGIMSERSSWRIPYFINGNLQNISGKTWYQDWDDLVVKVRKKSGEDLARIKSRPLTHTEILTRDGGLKIGTAVSPDGKWLAYLSDNSDQEAGLYIANLKTRRIDRVEQTTQGGEITITPDSSTVIYSNLARRSHYYLWSDLKAHDLRTGTDYWITDSLRARDPNVSHDGKWVTFTIVIDQTFALARAPLYRKGGRYKIGAPETVYLPEKYDAVYSPKYSADGRKIYFTLHRNGRASQEIVELDLTSRQTTTLVENGHMNFEPMIRNSELYFISDLTGVDNLYRYRAGATPELVTNVTTGIQFPTAGPAGQVYAQVFSYRGWDVARIDLLEKAADPRALTISPPDYPKPDENSSDHAKTESYASSNYSIWPSILPRQWAPVFYVGPQSVYMGGEVIGFDAVDLHSYVLEGAYDSQTKTADYFALYSNRQLGVTLNASTELTTTGVSTYTDGSLASYTRRRRYTLSASYPFMWTYSTLTPFIQLHGERNYLYVPGANPSDDDIVDKGVFTPYLDADLVYYSGQSSRLAISPEEGRRTEIGARTYLGQSTAIVKELIRDTEYLRTDAILKHSVLVPSAAFSAVDHMGPYPNTHVTVAGRATGQLLNGIPSTSLDQLAIRGYPNQTLYVRQAGVASLDYRFPLAQIFRGWGTNPVFLDNISGFGFAECAFFPTTEIGARGLPSAGGGISINTTFFNSLPIVLTTQYNKGFRESLGGKSEVFFQLGVPALSL